MRINEIKAKGYSVFPATVETRKKSMWVGAIKYVEQLAAITNTNIASWDILALLSNQEGDYYTDRTKINKIFFAKKSEIDLSPVSTSVPDQFRYEIEKLKNINPSNLESMQKKANSAMVEATRLSVSASSKILEARKIQVFIDKVTGKQIDYMDEINQVIREGFWELDKVKDGIISMRTVSDVWLTYKNVAHAVNIKLCFGRYVFSYKLGQGRLWPFEYERNLRYNVGSTGYIHPHISGIGEHANICWGTMQTDANNAIVNGDVVGVFSIAAQHLCNYNHDSAYVHMDKYKDLYERIELANKENSNEQKQMALGESGEEARQILTEALAYPPNTEAPRPAPEGF